MLMMTKIAGGEWFSSVRPPEPLSLTTSQGHGRSKEDQERVVDTMRSCENWSCKTNIITQWTCQRQKIARSVATQGATEISGVNMNCTTTGVKHSFCAFIEDDVSNVESQGRVAKGIQ